MIWVWTGLIYLLIFMNLDTYSLPTYLLIQNVGWILDVGITRIWSAIVQRQSIAVANVASVLTVTASAIVIVVEQTLSVTDEIIGEILSHGIENNAAI